MAQIDCELDETRTPTELASEASDDDYEECDAQEDTEEDECDEEPMHASNKIINKSTYTGKFYDEFDRKQREFQMQTKEQNRCHDTGRLPLDYSELMSLDIILSERRDRLTWAMYLLNYKKPIYDIVQLQEIYDDFISAFGEKDTVYNMAVEIGGDDERWLNIVNQLKDHPIRKIDIEEIYVNYISRKHKGVQLPDEEDPLINGFQFDNYEYLIKKG